MDICKALITDAKANPKSVKAAQLAQILRFLGQARKVLDEAEKTKEEIDEEIQRQEDEDLMTPEERQMIEEFEALDMELEGEPIYPDEDEKSKKINEPFRHGF